MNGTIPPSIFNISSMMVIYVGSGGGNDLSFLSSLVNDTRPTTLQILEISNNGFGRMLPQEICNLTELIDLLINDNQIHGSVPHGIVNLRRGDKHKHYSQQSRSSHIIHECLNLIIEIGVACSQEFPGERMNISNVVPKLHFLREKLLKSRNCGVQNIH
ncbi:hypothetical protein CFOL_v3_34651 [Cephalotus follicularis]|uniref:Uncharacterized protein n=1 Tax=Cephalotus follicularis TaxID=3775 RepID=A0A1Q3DFN8_CEPFO|nr:hypothetical protein CFOL_v3_34651 [Cephalotus follicularis]